eukprot:gene19741-20212_t
MQSVVRVAVLVGLFGCVVGFPAVVGDARGAAFSEAARASERQVADFKADPGKLLKSNPIGGLQLTSLVKALLLTDPSLADQIMGLLKTATKAQISAIGTGIGQAKLAYEQQKDEASLKIAKALGDKVSAASNEVLSLGFDLGTADVSSSQSSSTASTSAPGGGVNGSTTTQSTTTPNATTQHTTSTSNPSATQQSFAGATVSCTTSVSPKRSC